MYTMATRTRVRLYKGIVEAEAEERFRSDAVWAVRDGWVPTAWHWDGLALRVTYTFGQAPSLGEPTRAPARRRLSMRVRSLARPRPA
jgi:hypothetical protein